LLFLEYWIGVCICSAICFLSCLEDIELQLTFDDTFDAYLKSHDWWLIHFLSLFNRLEGSWLDLLEFELLGAVEDIELMLWIDSFLTVKLLVRRCLVLNLENLSLIVDLIKLSFLIG